MISISCSDEHEKKVIKEDFISTLRELIKQGKTGGTIQFITLSDHHSQKIIDPEDAKSVLEKTGAQFMIYGRVRGRKINSKPHHVLNLEGLVAHKPIPDKISLKLAKEFKELFPRRLQIPTENDLFSFEFTSQWTDCVARYIIGIATALSGGVSYAERLFKDVINILEQRSENFPIYKKLKERVPRRLAELYQLRAYNYYDLWFRNKTPEAIVRMGEEIDKIEPQFRDRYLTIGIRAIHSFLTKKDTKEAIAILEKCNSKFLKDATWRFSLAFLYAYDGNLDNALRQYTRARNYSIHPKTLAELEDFICWMLEEEPPKYQFYFCPGYINWQI